MHHCYSVFKNAALYKNIIDDMRSCSVRGDELKDPEAAKEFARLSQNGENLTFWKSRSFLNPHFLLVHDANGNLMTNSETGQPKYLDISQAKGLGPYVKKRLPDWQHLDALKKTLRGNKQIQKIEENLVGIVSGYFLSVMTADRLETALSSSTSSRDAHASLRDFSKQFLDLVKDHDAPDIAERRNTFLNDVRGHEESTGKSNMMPQKDVPAREHTKRRRPSEASNRSRPQSEHIAGSSVSR